VKPIKFLQFAAWDIGSSCLWFTFSEGLVDKIHTGLLMIIFFSTRNRIEVACRSLGYEPPVICTPEELMEE
jgi:hypothetical protein